MCHRAWPFCTQYSPQAGLLGRFGGPPTVSCVACTSPPMLLVPHTMLVDGHIFMTMYMCTAVPPKPPIKEAILAKSVSLSLALKPSTLLKSLAVTFPWLHHMCCPHRTTCYICSLSSFCYTMCIFSTVCIGATPYRCAA